MISWYIAVAGAAVNALVLECVLFSIPFPSLAGEDTACEGSVLGMHAPRSNDTSVL